MPIRFEHPAFLLLLLLLLLLPIYRRRRATAPSSRGRSGRIGLGIQLLTFLALVAGLAEPQVARRSQGVCVIFALDCSKSVPERERERALALVSQTLRQMKGKDRMGLLVFGQEASVELYPSPRSQAKGESWGRSPQVESPVRGDRTDIAAALRLARGLFPEGYRKRLVLLSDGQDNRGEPLEEAIRLKLEDVGVNVVPIGARGDRPEVLVDGLLAPPIVGLGEGFTARAVVKGNFRGTGWLRLFADGSLLEERAIDLPQGEGQFSFPVKLETPGLHSLTVRLEADGDGTPENNGFEALVAVGDRPRILYTTGMEGKPPLAEILRANGLQVDRVAPGGLPRQLSALGAYRAVVLENVPAGSLSQAQMELLETYVHNRGGGLIMVGGDRAFGAGDYRGTPIERLLPVSMDLRQKRRHSRMALMLVLDKSGSMAEGEESPSKMERAAEAALASLNRHDREGLVAPGDENLLQKDPGISRAKSLREDDLLGVIAFDKAALEILSLQERPQEGELERAIRALRPGGGTDLYPALKLAHERLRSSGAAVKHVILLSDGKSRGRDPKELAREMKKDRITISAVGIGEDCNQGLLQQVAHTTGGRLYLARDWRQLPKIFSQDVLLAAGPLVVEEAFVPQIVDTGEGLAGIKPPLPPLYGYIAASPKGSARTLLISRRGDPILATWRYGLGRSAAYTSDGRGHWSRDWLAWKEFSRLWVQLVRWTAGGEQGKAIEPTLSLKGKTATIFLDALAPDGSFENSLRVVARVASPHREIEDVELAQVAPGRYEGSARMEEEGLYTVRLSLQKEEQEVISWVRGLFNPGQPEYRTLGIDRPRLAQIAEAAGGRLLSEAGNPFEVRGNGARGYRELWRECLVLAVLLFLVKVAWHRYRKDLP